MTINVSISQKREKEIIKLIARKTIDGQVIIDDHPDISIVLNLRDKKITCFPKDHYEDSVYFYSNKLFKFLARKGIIDLSSIKGGSAYASLEATYPEPQGDISISHILLLCIYRFMLQELPDVEFRDYLKKKQEEFFANPDDFESTELGEIPARDDPSGNGMNVYQRYLNTFTLYEE